ncbi:zinc finger protein 37-like isoform X2 [Toxotes jaculatrix]|uniref:zinc finger protein 37-like isoform X2 n=1 Tax=Toxotes jaculatrix TaxID=941984 RepID=UPI001B3AB6BD|nr:zinc finger protein 37-like isoform X2 [Toxotes jaculatrix]
MSSVQYLRDFVTERLTAAAEEIFGVFEKTIVEYEAEVDRQRRLLDIVWQPEIKLHRIELPQQHVCQEEEVLSDQQLCDQERNSSLDQEDPDPPQIKEEEEETCSGQEGEQLVLKQETDAFMLTPDYEGSDHTEPEPGRDQQLLSHSSPVDESQDQTGSKHVDSGLTRIAETKTQKTQHKNRSHSNSVSNKELPQQHVCQEEEVLSDQQLCDQERNSSLDQEDPDPPQIKEEEEEETCSGQEGEQLVLKQETDAFMLTPDYEGSDHTEPEPGRDQQLLSHSSPVDESQDQTGSKHVDSELTRNAETKTQKRQHNNRSHSNSVYNKELPQQHVCQEEEVLSDQQLCDQERNSSLDQEDPDPPQIKEEEEETCSGQEGEQLVLKQETDAFILTPDYEGSDHTEPEPGRDQQLLSHSSPVDESRDQTGSKHVDSGLTRNVETKTQKRQHKNRNHSNSVSNKELPQQHVCQEEEVLSDQQLCDQERNSSLDQEDPDPPQIKEEEEEETCSGQEGEQLVLKQETDAFILTPDYEGSDHTEPEPGRDQQLLSHSSPVDESQDQTGSKHVDSELTRNVETKPQSSQHSNSVSNTGENSFKCDTCGKIFKHKFTFIEHLRIHTGEKPNICDMCGKRFRSRTGLLMHRRTHTGERPHSCSTCGRRFIDHSGLKKHMRSHTGEKPYSCEICGKGFACHGSLKAHRRSHTGEKPYSCEICGKGFAVSSILNVHRRSHTGEKPFPCSTCGKTFSRNSVLKKHTRVHTGEKPFSCETCGKRFIQLSDFKRHARVHTRWASAQL